MRKSQISTEFLVIVSIALLVFLIIFAIIDKRNDELYSTRTKLYAKQEADKLASNINIIFLAGDGANKTISLPETLRDDRNYSMNIYPSSHLAEIRWSSLGENRQYKATLITSNITGSLTSLKNQTLTITNSNGGVVIG